MSFEDEMSDAFRRTGEEFRLRDAGTLVEGGLTRGHRRVARRRVAVTAGVLAVALATGGGLYVGSKERTDTAAKPFKVSAPQIENILDNAIQQMGLAVEDRRLSGRGSSTALTPARASVNYDDGWGRASTVLTVRRVDATDPSLTDLITCPPEGSSPYEECTTRPGDRVVKGYTDAGRAGGVKKWVVTMVSTKGYLIEIATSNVKASPGDRKGEAPQSRNPRLGAPKLRLMAAFVESSFTREGAPNKFGTTLYGSESDSGDFVAMIKYLLPKRFQVVSQGDGDVSGHVVVKEGNSPERTYIEVTRTAAVLEGQVRNLPHGIKVGTQELPGREPGVVQLRADALWPNYMSISVSAYNATSPKSGKSAAEPMITMDELTNIAADGVWHVARSVMTPASKTDPGAAPKTRGRFDQFPSWAPTP
ncbi:hypothetical protein ACFQ61_04000 [Streptomyces sp. NPDC056500]|uniref:hypothetical protein n=1 Tax=Streptomyces sp. NPDC056500 TaxID=3345840 RepID=UPI003681D959